MIKFVNLCLHSCYCAENLFHFGEIIFSITYILQWLGSAQIDQVPDFTSISSFESDFKGLKDLREE